MEQALLNLRIQLEELITQREGMIAENMQRQQLGHSMAYTGENFEWIQQEMESVRSRLQNP